MHSERDNSEVLVSDIHVYYNVPNCIVSDILTLKSPDIDYQDITVVYSLHS